VRPPSSRSAAIPEEATHMTIFPWLRTFAATILYKNVLLVPARPLTKNRVPNSFSTELRMAS
jgi:hypothetical protein